MQKILFIDRDGTLVEEPENFQVDCLSKIRFYQGVIPALLALQDAGYQLVMVSNQDGIGTSSFPESSFRQCQEFILNVFKSQGIQFNQIFICPHRQVDNCACRKPKTGLVDEFMCSNPIDKLNSCMIGDRTTDQEFAQNLGIPFILINSQNNWQDIARKLIYSSREFSIQRNTKETSLDITVRLDDDSNSQISTPIAFFSHMLEQIARHGGFYLQVLAKGDVEVDDHHLIEDTAITLGEALKQALGNKIGLSRYGFTLPMDESLATVAIDLCGRSFCRFEGQFTREMVGGVATEMIPHFFNSLANALGASIHVKVEGQNHHHMIEACFKALGRALRQALLQDGNLLPSTKGIL